MWNIKNDSILREKISNITEEEQNHGDNIGNQINLIQSLSQTIPHSVELVEEARVGEDNSWRYTCYMFAFGIRDKPIKNKFVLQDIFPNSIFTQYLIKHHLSEIDIKGVRDEDYVIYFDGGTPKHAGKVEGNKIISKWGTAHRWSHGIFEIPSDYGTTVKFYKHLCVEKIYQIFNQWAETELKKKSNS